MAHTYGEVLEGSFGEVFNFLRGPLPAFVDVGSGFGSIVFAAAQHGCLSIGIGTPPLSPTHMGEHVCGGAF